MVASGSQAKQGNASDFRRLNPSVFSGEESHLDDEQWLIDTEKLLVVARVSKANRVDVVKIQLSRIARIWWLAEESHLLGPVSWKTFSEVFLAKFFPDMTKSEMEQKLINLKQAGRTFDEYATEFSKLSRFAHIWSLPRRIGAEDFNRD